MKRIAAIVAATSLAVAGVAVRAASAEEHEPIPPHGHLLVQGAVIDFGPDGPALLEARRCVPLAAGQALPLKAQHQHQHVHFGTADQMLIAKAGHVVVPVAPFPEVPWTNCAELFDIFGL